MNVSKTKKRRNGEPLIKKRRRNRKPDPPWQTGEGATLEQRRLIAETSFCVIERLRENDVCFFFYALFRLRESDVFFFFLCSFSSYEHVYL